MSSLWDEGVTRTALVRAIHEAPVACVLELAGAGTPALGWLHAVGGSADTVLEAHDRYHTDALAATLGGPPARAIDPAVASVLATAAFDRAKELSGRGVAVVGLGCTAALVTSRPRRGPHVCYVATYDGLGIRRLAVRMNKGVRDRSQEEEVAARLVLSALATAAGVDPRSIPSWQGPEPIEVLVEDSPELSSILAGRSQVMCRATDGTMLVDPPAENRAQVEALLSGSFDPLHDGHRGLAAAAAEYLEMEVVYELPVVNADKSPLDAVAAHLRAAQFLGRADLWLTRAALYTEKGRLFPGAVFVVGADTAQRVLQPRFYGGEQQMLAAVDAIAEAGCRFLVAARMMLDGLLTLGQLAVPDHLRSVFTELPAERFCLDRSSSQIRSELNSDA